MNDTPFVPSFDDDSASTGRKLAIICSKGNLDMAYPGLILANAAVGEGIETHLFFTFWGFDIINKATMGDLQFSFVGNTAMHPPGHSGMGVHHMLGALPGATKAASSHSGAKVPARCSIRAAASHCASCGSSTGAPTSTRAPACSSASALRRATAPPPTTSTRRPRRSANRGNRAGGCGDMR